VNTPNKTALEGETNGAAVSRAAENEQGGTTTSNKAANKCNTRVANTTRCQQREPRPPNDAPDILTYRFDLNIALNAKNVTAVRTGAKF